MRNLHKVYDSVLKYHGLLSETILKKEFLNCNENDDTEQGLNDYNFLQVEQNNGCLSLNKIRDYIPLYSR